MITLKKSSLGEPNIFSTLSQNIYISVLGYWYSSRRKIGEMVNLKECLDGDTRRRLYARTGLSIYCGAKGYFTDREKAFLLFVFKNDSQHVVLSKEFLEDNKSIHSSIKKQLKEMNIPKANWIYLNQAIIQKEFQDLLVPTIDDYLPENQKIVVDEFKLYMEEEFDTSTFDQEVY